MPPIPPLQNTRLHSKNVALAVIPPPVVTPSPPPASIGIGELIVFSDDISLPDDPSTKIGEHSGLCTRVRATPGAPGNTNLYQCQATFTLPEGQVTARGVVALPVALGDSNLFAISGGTEKYDNLRGQVKVTNRGGNEQDYEFRTYG